MFRIQTMHNANGTTHYVVKDGTSIGRAVKQGNRWRLVNLTNNEPKKLNCGYVSSRLLRKVPEVCRIMDLEPQSL